jgi:hypothetical protein
VSTAIRQEIRELAYTMVRLEQSAHEAVMQRDYIRAGELNEQRLEAQARRSELIRQVWQPRRRRRDAA